jgi:hypothetical protein
MRGAMPVAAPSSDGLADAFAVPTDPAAYHITVPAEFERDAELEAKARRWFHQAGLPQSVVNGIVQAYCRALCLPLPDESVPNMAAGMSPSAGMLESEWGPDFPRKVAAAQEILAKAGDSTEIAALLAETGLGDDPWLIRTLATLAELQAARGGAA